MQHITDSQLKSFVEESNKIEGIRLVGKMMDECCDLHGYFLGLEKIDIESVAYFVLRTAQAVPRFYSGMNVKIGRHFPIPGGPDVKLRLLDIIDDINNNAVEPFKIHRRYESLHPFMDGNGRSGRLLWLWHNLSINEYMGLGFLHQWYYDSLSNRD